jgi:two-component system nitrogen regulation sensor histidine kinase NtrY
MAGDFSGRTSHMARFERRVMAAGLWVAAPAWLAVAALLFGSAHIGWFWMPVVAALAATLLLLHWHQRHIVYPVYTLAGLLEALREGDYSLRGARDGVLGEVVYDVNALAAQLKRERLQFEESTYLLRKTLAALDSAVLVFDSGHRLRLRNPAARRLLNDTRRPALDLSAGELGLAALLEGPASCVRTYEFPERSGRFEIRHAPLWRSGRSGQLLVINDVERVLREEERQAWQRLLRVLGHEVNNSLAPIRSITGTLASLLTRDPLPADWRNDFESGLGIIGHRAESLTRFLSGYGQLARLPPPKLRQLDVSVLASKVAGLEQRLTVQVKTGESLFVNADADQLEQALINLLRNAVEAANPVNGYVSLRWRRESFRAVIEVEDNGPGPPSSGNLFVPFFTTKPNGSGIGLALVRQIAEAHDGGVALLARPDAAGAVAQLWLPVPGTPPPARPHRSPAQDTPHAASAADRCVRPLARASSTTHVQLDAAPSMHAPD